MMTSSHVKKLEVAEMKMCRWACSHTLRDHVRNSNIAERLKVENITEWQKSETGVVWTCEETRQRIRRRNGTTREKMKRKTESGMEYCVNRDMRAIGTAKDEVHDINSGRRIVCAAATPQLSVSG